MSKDDATWLKICYAIAAIIIAYTGWKAMGTIGLHSGLSEKYVEVFPLVATVVSIAIGVLVTWYLAHDSSRNDYFLAAIGETRKVTWPTFIDTRRMTMVVCIVVGVFAVIVAIFDAAWARVLRALLP
jgi:preprotein translocase subunit SecE